MSRSYSYTPCGVQVEYDPQEELVGISINEGWEELTLTVEQARKVVHGIGVVLG